MCDGAISCWEWLNTCLTTGSGEFTLCFALLTRTAFAFPIKLSFSPPTSVLPLTLSIPIPSLGDKEQAAVWGNSLGLNHDKQEGKKALCQRPLRLDGGYQPNHRHAKARMGTLSKTCAASSLQPQEFTIFPPLLGP